MTRYFIFAGWIISFAGCGQISTDPTTPEGAHNKFVEAFENKDYKTVYELLTSETKGAFHEYLDTTREVVSLIRSKYPEALVEKAIDDLSIPFKQDTFRFRDIEKSGSEEEVFVTLCRCMFAAKDETPSLMQKFGTKIQSVTMEDPNQAIIKTLAGETLTYVREKDQQWKTGEIFGINFKNLVLVGRQNLKITITNIDIFSK